MRLRFLIPLLGVIWIAPAHAVPSFARQMGVGCEICHTAYPELTAYGRWFKLHGYTAKGPDRKGLDRLPIAAMLQLSDSITNDKGAGTTDDFPYDRKAVLQQASIFIAGRLSDHAGAFIQVTSDGVEHHTSLDLADLRYVWNPTASGHDLLVGMTANNNPTVTDPWNTLPVWGYPYAGSSVAPSPNASVLLDGALGGQVAGLGAYTMLDQAWYAEVSLYVKGQPGLAHLLTLGNALETAVDGIAPYWRVAWQRDAGSASYSIGASGMVAKILADPLENSGPTDRFSDVGVDGQYMWTASDWSFSAHLAYMHEHQRHDASIAAGAAAEPSGSLESLKANVSFVLRHRYAASLGYTQISGSTDTLLYPADEPFVGSRTASPDSSALLFEFDYLPFRQLKFSAQYTAYGKFNGASADYDGFGRSASANNTLYLLGWLML